MSPGQTRRDKEQAVLAAAESWLVRLNNPDATGKDRAAFGAWRLRASEHARAYARAEELWQRSGEFLDALEDEPEVSAVIAEARAVPEAAGPSLRAGPRRRGFLRPRASARPAGRTGHTARWRRWAVAASLIIGVAGGAWVTLRLALPEPEPRLLATAVGERQTITLEDGSLVTLDAASQIEVLYVRNARTARLLDGRARFTVAPDRTRPFTVEAGEGSVTALGTVFDISNAQGTVTVTLLEGDIEVAEDRGALTSGRASGRVRLQAGQRVVYSAGAGLSSPTAVDLAAASAWSDGRLVFSDARLGDAVAEFNRYTAKPIRFADPALADLELRGTFNADDPASFLEAVSFLFPLRTVEDETTILLTPDPAPDKRASAHAP